MADDKKKVRGNKDEGSGNMPEDPGSNVAKGPTDKVRANKDKGKKSGEDG